MQIIVAPLLSMGMGIFMYYVELAPVAMEGNPEWTKYFGYFLVILPVFPITGFG